MTGEISAVSVVGLGKLGACMAALFAQHGLKVVGVDVVQSNVDAVNAGRAPVDEPTLDALLHGNSESIRATTSISEAVAASSASFVIVPTPSKADGSFSHELVKQVCEEIGAALKDKSTYHLVVITSTVMPGATGGEIREVLEEASGKSCGADFGLCYSPEFIALGSVIADMLNPDFVLIGESDRLAGECLVEIYNRIYFGQQTFARMNFVNAELTKLAVNTYVTTKISYANMLAQLCGALPESNADIVSSAIGLDRRIGSSYLKGALPFGGPCFPRDNKAFTRLSNELGVDAILARATDEQNQSQLNYLNDIICNKISDSGVVGVLGLAYKAGTSVVEGSPSLSLIAKLAKSRKVLAHDPAAGPNASKIIGDLENVRICEELSELIEKSDVVIIAQPWQEYLEIPTELFSNKSTKTVVIDAWRQRTDLEQAQNVEYVAVGHGPTPSA